MKLLNSDKDQRALTLVDVLIITVVVFLIMIFLVVPQGKSRARAQRISCVNNLRQIGTAFRVWSSPHSQESPWNLLATNGEPLSFAGTTDLWRHFEIASNELGTPKSLWCPADTGRVKATLFDTNFSNQNISYFVGVDVDETKPQSILSGDRNLSTNNSILSGIVVFPKGASVRWTTAIHNSVGNIALGDGSAQQASSAALSNQLSNSTPFRLAIP